MVLGTLILWVQFSLCSSTQSKCDFFLGASLPQLMRCIYGDIGWLAPKYRKCFSMVRLWNRLVSFNDDSRLTRAVFLQDAATNRETWSSEIQYICIYYTDIFTELGLEHSFNTLSKVDLNLFKLEIYSRRRTCMWVTMYVETIRLKMRFIFCALVQYMII